MFKKLYIGIHSIRDFKKFQLQKVSTQIFYTIEEEKCSIYHF